MGIWIKILKDSNYHTEKSDISQDFEVGDIFTWACDISASERRGLEEKNRYLFLGSDFSLHYGSSSQYL